MSKLCVVRWPCWRSRVMASLPTCLKKPSPVPFSLWRTLYKGCVEHKCFAIFGYTHSHTHTIRFIVCVSCRSSFRSVWRQPPSSGPHPESCCSTKPCLRCPYSSCWPLTALSATSVRTYTHTLYLTLSLTLILTVPAHTNTHY